jgi:hypothetical protein
VHGAKSTLRVRISNVQWCRATHTASDCDHDHFDDHDHYGRSNIDADTVTNHFFDDTDDDHSGDTIIIDFRVDRHGRSDHFDDHDHSGVTITIDSRVDRYGRRGGAANNDDNNNDLGFRCDHHNHNGRCRRRVNRCDRWHHWRCVGWTCVDCDYSGRCGLLCSSPAGNQCERERTRLDPAAIDTSSIGRLWSDLGSATTSTIPRCG